MPEDVITQCSKGTFPETRLHMQTEMSPQRPPVTQLRPLHTKIEVEETRSATESSWSRPIASPSDSDTARDAFVKLVSRITILNPGELFCIQDAALGGYLLVRNGEDQQDVSYSFVYHDMSKEEIPTDFSFGTGKALQLHVAHDEVRLIARSDLVPQSAMDVLGQTLTDIMFHTPTNGGDLVSQWTHLSVLNWPPIEKPVPLSPGDIQPATQSLLHHWFEKRVQEYPDRIAIEFLVDFETEQKIQYTYQEVSDAATFLAGMLRDASSHSNVAVKTVAVLIDPSPELYVSYIAALKAGIAFCPVPVDAPDERKAALLSDLNPVAILSQETDKQELRTTSINVSKLLKACEGSLDQQEPFDSINENQAAYILYTSGTTGMPKGVTVSHLSAACTVSSLSSHFQFSSHEISRPVQPLRWLQSAVPTFDISLFEIFWTFSTGSTLCCAPRHLIMGNIDKTITILEADILNVTPTVASLIDPSSIGAIMVGGEVLSTRLVRSFSLGKSSTISDSTMPQGIYNGYGPTEVTIYSVAQAHVPLDQRGSVIGTPLATCGALIVDSERQSIEPVPMGAIGELVLTGPQVSQTGYLNRPEETAKAFLDDQKWGRAYRTGDRARIVWNEKGEPSIEFLGRMSDEQVKLSGRRVELSEIENTLASKTKGIQQILACLWKPQNGISGSEKVVALLMVDPKTTLDFENVRSLCMETASKSLPEYMRPFKIVQVNSLPHSASGKIDRKAASEYVRRTLEKSGNHKILNKSVDYPALEKTDDEVKEKRIVELLAAIIGEESATESWFTAITPFQEVGVDSLRAMRLLHGIRNEWPDMKKLQPPIASMLDPAANIRSVFFSSNARIVGESMDRDKWKAQIADFSSRNMTESLLQLSAISESDIEMILPMTSTQNQLAVNFAKDHRNYISHTLLSLKRDVSMDALETAVNNVLGRNAIYRCALVSCNDDISPFAQVVLEPGAWNRWTGQNPRVIRQGRKANNNPQEWLDLAHQYLKFESQTLYYIQLIEDNSVSEDICGTLVISVAHCLCDGPSIQVLLSDISREYASLDPLPRLGIEDAVLDWISHVDTETDKEWQTLLKDWEPERFHALAGQNTKSALPGLVADYGHGMIEFSGDLRWETFEAKSRALGASPLSVLQASWSLILHSMSEANTGEIVFGSVLSGHYEPTHAPTFSVVPCRVALPDRETVGELLHTLGTSSRFAQSHRNMSFGVFETLPYNTALALQSYSAPHLDLTRDQNATFANMDPWDKIETPAIRYDFDIFVELLPTSLQNNGLNTDNMSFKLTYRDDALSPVSAQVILRQFSSLIDVILSSSSDEIVKLLPSRIPKSLLSSEGTIPVSPESKADEDRQLRERSEVLHAQFENQAEMTPNLLALSFYSSLNDPPTELTYAELDARANGLANILREEDLDIIPICMRRSIELYVAILAILKAGSAWSPIDETLPIKRLTSLIARTEGKVILTNKDSLHLLEPCLADESLAGVRVILVDNYESDKTSIRAEPRHTIRTLRPGVQGQDLAYLLWTSGTTGEPKGVMIQHYAAANAMRDLQIQVDHEKGVPVRTLQLSAYSFDVFVQDLFFTWGLAGSVISGTRELVLGTFTEFVKKSLPTHAHLTPSFGASVDVEELRGSSLKTVTFIGEKLTEDVAEAWAAPGITTRAYNTYGPAENAVVSTMRQFYGKSRDHAKAANVGFPLTPCTAYVVRNVASEDEIDNPKWELVPRYGVGELALGGAQVAKGYLKNEAKTTKAFIQGGPGINERIYLTGDMVRLNDHGLEFLGRNDDLVKITGIRIELSEISAACAATKDEEPAVEHIETLYLPRPGGSGDQSNYKVVVTFVSVKQEGVDLDKIRMLIFKKAREMLPAYMVPGHVVILDTSMPRTASNKVDRKALQSIYKDADLNSLAERDVRTMENSDTKSQWTENQLSILPVITEKSFSVPIDTLAPEDSLAGLGFSSLQVTKLAWALRRQNKCNVSVIDLMQCQSLGELVDVVARSMEKAQNFNPGDAADDGASWVTNLTTKLTKSLHGELRPRDTSYILPATPFQESLLVETMIDPGAYWSHRIFDLNHLDSVDASRLRDAWNTAASQLDILRTVFLPLSELSVLDEESVSIAKWAYQEGVSATMLQLVLNKPCITWEILQNADQSDLASLAKKIQMDWAIAGAKSPRPPWTVSFSNGNNQMMLSMHHALHDGTSSSMLLDIVEKLYENPEMIPDVEKAPLQMAKGMELGLLPTIVQRNDALSAWSKYIHDLVAMEGSLNAQFPDLTGSRKRKTGILSERRAMPDLLQESPAGSPSLPQLVQSAFGCVLAEILELKAVVLGQTISQRVLHPDLARVMGPAMATVPVAVRAHASSAHHLWSEMSRDSLSLSRNAHSLHPVDIKKLINTGSDQSQAPFPALFVYHPATTDDEDKIDCNLDMFRETGQALSLNVEHPLALNIFEAEKSIELSGNSSFISQSMLKLLLDQILDQARTMLKFPDAPLDQISNFMSNKLVSCIGEVETLVGKEIVENPADLVTGWATKHPDWIAAEEVFLEESDDSGDDRIVTQALTYGELEELVNAIASKLRNHKANIQPDDVVALYLRRDLKSLASILAIFRCNFIYLPIDADLPATRKQLLVRDADAKLVLTTESLIPDLDLGSEKDPPSLLLPETHDELDLISSWPTESDNNADRPHAEGGYLLYTSGSTGRPKGVRVSSKNLLHFISAMTQRLSEANPDTAILGGTGKYLNVASRAFDTHLTSMFAPWHLGFCSAISKDRNGIFANLQQVINEVKITHMGSVPSVIVQLGLRLEDIPSMRVLTIGGEKASHELFDQLSTENQTTALMNFYGPTECTVGCFSHKVGETSNARNLGFPLRGLEAILLVPRDDGKQVIARRGQPGELCVSGPQVAIGYMNRPEENAKSFQYTSLLGGDNKRIYRTGDIMRMMPDGTVEFLGRKDQQTKIRGQRFEIDEVVSFIKKTIADQRTLDVAAAVVDQQLVGFLARKNSALLKAELESEPELIAHHSKCLCELLTTVERACQEALPAFMVPEMMWVSKIPYLAASGKIDSKYLANLAKQSWKLQQSPQPETSSAPDGATPLTKSEMEVVAALQEVMGKDVSVTSTHGIHGLGIDSLSGVHLVSVLRRRGFRNVNLVELLSPACTVGTLARLSGADVQFGQSLTSPSSPSLKESDSEELSLKEIYSGLGSLDQENVAAVLHCLPLQSSLVALSLNWLDSNDKMADGAVPYVTEFIYELSPGTDILQWKSVAMEVISSEATLRTCFMQNELDGKVFQVVLKSVPSPFQGEDDARSLVSQMNTRPPVRLRVQQDQTSGKTLVSLLIHHALYDGLAIAALRDKLEQGYINRLQAQVFENRSLSHLKKLSNYCHLDDEQTHAATKFWRSKLNGIQPCLVAKTSENKAETMARFSRRLSYTTVQLKAKLQSENSISMSTAFQLATVLCIADLTKERSAVYGFTMSLRPLLNHVVDEIDNFVGPCLNTVVHALEIKSAIETLPQLAERIHRDHRDVCEGKMPIITADKIQSWTRLEEKLFDSILTINFVSDNDNPGVSQSVPGHLTPLPGNSKTDLALAIDVDLHADGRIILSLASAGVLAEAQLERVGTLFEKIVDCSANSASTVGQFAPLVYRTNEVTPDCHPVIPLTSSNTQQVDNFFNSALTCVQSAASKLLRLDAATVSAKEPKSTSLYQLGIDSLNIIPFIKAINNSESIRITPNAAIRARTVYGVALLVAQAKREHIVPKTTAVQTPARAQGHADSRSPYDQTLERLAGDLLFVATPLQEGMLSASMAIEQQAYTYVHTMQLSRIAREKDTPNFDYFLTAVSDTVRQCEILRSRFIFVQSDESPWVGVVSPTDQSDLVDWKVSNTGVVELRIHHALYDASSMNRMWQILNQNYAKRLGDNQGHRNDQEDGKYLFRPFARSSSLAQTAAVAFWVDTVKDYKYNPVVIHSEVSRASSSAFMNLPASELSNLQVKCRASNVTLKVALELAWAKVLCEAVYKQPDVVFGELIALGNDETGNAVMGPTINTIPIRVGLTSGNNAISISDALAQLQTLSENSRGMNGMASLRSIQGLWRSTNTNTDNTTAGLFQSLFVFDGVIHSEESGSSHNLILATESQAQSNLKSDDKGPAYDDYPFIVSFRIMNGELHGKLRSSLGQTETKDLVDKLGAALQYISSGDLQSSALGSSHLHFKDGSWKKQLDLPMSNGNHDIKVQSTNDSTATKAAAVLEIARKVVGDKIRGREIRLDTKLMNIGLDSISSIRFSRALKTQLGIHASVFEIIKGASAQSIADKSTLMQSNRRKHQEKPSSSEILELKGRVAERLKISSDSVHSIVPVLSGQRWTLQHWLRCGKRFFEPPRVYRVHHESIDERRVAGYWKELCRMHDVLRTTFVHTSESPLLQVTLDENLTTAQSLMTAKDCTITVSELIQKHIRHYNNIPSDLSKPPVSLSFLEACDGKAIVLRIHHALYDAWNIKLILKDLVTLFSGGSLPQYPSLRDSIQQIIDIRQPDAETAYWKQYLAQAQDTFVLPAFVKTSDRKNPLRPHFKTVSDDFISFNRPSASAWGKSFISAAIIMAYGRVLSEFTGRSRPTFFFNHSSRLLETSNGDDTIDLTNMSIPTMTVTPLTVDIETSSTKLSLEAVQDHLAQLTRFSQADNPDGLGPGSNCHLNIIYPEGDNSEEMNPNQTAEMEILQRHKLEEPLASDYFTKTKPSSTSSTIDNLDTSSIRDEQLYFNVLVFPNGKYKLSVSGHEDFSRGEPALATALINNFVSQLSHLTEA